MTISPGVGGVALARLLTQRQGATGLQKVGRGLGGAGTTRALATAGLGGLSPWSTFVVNIIPGQATLKGALVVV